MKTTKTAPPKLLPFDPARLCYACAGDDAPGTYHGGAQPLGSVWNCREFLRVLPALGEHMCRRCSGCGYQWMEQVAAA